MRIIAGTARGTKLQTPEGDITRPTLERVKENFFNAIHFELEDAKVLDLFAGSGQLGLEALSRGARECVFADNRAECVEVITKNAQKTKLYDKCNILKLEYSEYLAGLKKRGDFSGFDVVFLDPPYKDNLRIIKEAVKRLLKHSLIKNNGIIVCESEKPVELDTESARFVTGMRVYRYGRVLITVLKILGEETNDG